MRGAEFTITTPDGEKIVTELTGDDGIVNVNLNGEGLFVVEETIVPAGYRKSNKKYNIPVKMDFKVPEGVVGKDISNEIGLSLYDFKVSESQVSGLNVEKKQCLSFRIRKFIYQLRFSF